MQIEVGPELGRFKNHEDWVNNAPAVYANAYQQAGCRDVITLDSALPRRVCLRGLQFNTARDEFTFPVVIYAIKAE